MEDTAAAMLEEMRQAGPVGVVDYVGNPPTG
jgi:hypothetical protein